MSETDAMLKLIINTLSLHEEDVFRRLNGIASPRKTIEHLADVFLTTPEKIKAIESKCIKKLTRAKKSSAQKIELKKILAARVAALEEKK